MRSYIDRLAPGARGVSPLSSSCLLRNDAGLPGHTLAAGGARRGAHGGAWPRRVSSNWALRPGALRSSDDPDPSAAGALRSPALAVFSALYGAFVALGIPTSSPRAYTRNPWASGASWSPSLRRLRTPTRERWAWTGVLQMVITESCRLRSCWSYAAGPLPHA